MLLLLLAGCMLSSATECASACHLCAQYTSSASPHLPSLLPLPLCPPLPLPCSPSCRCSSCQPICASDGVSLLCLPPSPLHSPPLSPGSVVTLSFCPPHPHPHRAPHRQVPRASALPLPPPPLLPRLLLLLPLLLLLLLWQAGGGAATGEGASWAVGGLYLVEVLSP